MCLVVNSVEKLIRNLGISQPWKTVVKQVTNPEKMRLVKIITNPENPIMNQTVII